jgi:ribonuclease Z
LIGLITTFNLNRRERPLHIYGPEGLKDIIDLQLEHSGARLLFPLEFHFTDTEKPVRIMENEEMKVYSFPLDHRIACTGFLFEEKVGLRHLIPDKLAQYKVPVDKMQGLREGQDLELPNGGLIPNEEMTTDPSPTHKYAYCSDTAFRPELAKFLHGVDLLYHEATFMESEKQRAKETRHSTAKQAAQFAKMVQAGKLVVGHFSSRYSDLNDLLEEAKAVFPDTELGLEGKVFSISSKE